MKTDICAIIKSFKKKKNNLKVITPMFYETIGTFGSRPIHITDKIEAAERKKKMFFRDSLNDSRLFMGFSVSKHLLKRVSVQMVHLEA